MAKLPPARMPSMRPFPRLSRCIFNLTAGLMVREREKNGEIEVKHVAGITGPRCRCKADYKGVKSIKITMYFSSRRCVPAGISVPPQMRRASGEGDERRKGKSSVTRSKGAEERRRGEGAVAWGTRKGTAKQGRRERDEAREGTECISAPPAETRDERRSALEDTDTFAGENAEK